MPIPKNNADETRPWLIICIIDPINALGLKAKIPSVTMPICAIEEYAISFLISVCASAINDAQTIAITLSTGQVLK
jgi:hypothetical protein